MKKINEITDNFRFTTHLLLLFGTACLSLFLTFYKLGQQGWGNAYYSAAVKSMLLNWHNFFFLSFDPHGFVTIDKPPLGFWFQALSAHLFGFSPFSIMLPQAIAGVGSVIVIYLLLSRYFTRTAGLIAAFLMAITPLNLVMSKINDVDSIIVFSMVLGAYFLALALEKKTIKYLLLSFFVIGLGFNTKTLEVALVLPALYIAYLAIKGISWKHKIIHLVIATVLFLIVSFSWITIVDMVPASARPYVGSTSDNSELSLTIGYNGISRLTGNGNRGGARIDTRNLGLNTNNQSSQMAAFQRQPQNAAGGFGQNGTPSIIRLFSSMYGPQIGWFMLFAAGSLVFLLMKFKRKFPFTLKQTLIILFGVWLLTEFTFFSIAGRFNEYYLVVITPPIVALSALGLTRFYAAIQKRTKRSYGYLPVLGITAGTQIYFLLAYPAYAKFIIPFIVFSCFIGIALFFILFQKVFEKFQYLITTLFILSFCGLLIAPVTWSFSSLNNATATTSAGPVQAREGNNVRSGTRELATFGNFGGFGGNTEQSPLSSQALSYIQKNQNNAMYSLATLSANTAATIMLKTNDTVVPLGGFSGSDKIISTSTLQNMIKQNVVHYFYIQNTPTENITTNRPTSLLNDREDNTSRFSGFTGGDGVFGGNANRDLTTYITSSCKQLYQNGSTIFESTAAKSSASKGNRSTRTTTSIQQETKPIATTQVPTSVYYCAAS